MKTLHERDNVIYGLSCICHPERGIRYVGLTSYTARHRLHGHRTSARKGSKTAVYNWMRKHGVLNIESTVLERTSTFEELNDAEVRWIAYYKSIGQELMNLTDGGGSTTPEAWTEEMRAAVSRRRTGQVASAETRAKQSASRKGRPSYVRTPETLAKMSIAHKGHAVTEQARVNMRASAKGHLFKAHTAESRALMSERRSGMLFGEANGRAKLTANDVTDIRIVHALGATFSDLARSYGMAESTITKIVRRKLWKSIA